MPGPGPLGSPPASFLPYSPECVGDEFCELRLDCVIRSSENRGAGAKRGLPARSLNPYRCLLLFWAVVARSVLADHSSWGRGTDNPPT
jgi:hypothetical protein